MNRWTRLLHLPTLLLSCNGLLAAEAPFAQISQSDGYRPEYVGKQVWNGRLLFSQYGPSGNAFDIVTLDPDTQTAEFIVHERPGGRFIDSNDRFLVIQQEGDVANPVLIFDAKSLAELGRVRLRSRVSWGQIRGDRLLLIQGNSYGSSYAVSVPALIYSLPDLKLLRSTTISGGSDVQLWDDYIISLGREAGIYDAEFQNVGSLVLPKPRSDRGVSCAATGPLRVTQDRAVIVSNCGDIHVFDLKTRSLERIIASFAHFYTADIVDGILFATALDTGPKGTRAFEIASGALLAVLPIDASHGLFAIGSRLVALTAMDGTYSHNRTKITTFAVDTAALRKGTWRAAQVAEGCAKAQAIVAQTGDVHAAIDLCRHAGIEAFIGESSLSPDTRTLLLNYATWLGRTFDQPAEAQRVLEWLAASGTSRTALSAALAEADAHKKTMARLAYVPPRNERRGQQVPVTDNPANFALDENERKSELGIRFVNRAALPTRTVTMNSEYPEVVDPDGKQVYGHRSGCRIIDCHDTGPSVVIYDRESLRELAAIPVVPFDDEYQDFIRSITVDAANIYVSLDYRYESVDRPNFIVIDKASRQLVKTDHIDITEASSNTEIETKGYRITREPPQSGKDKWRLTSTAGEPTSAVFEIPTFIGEPLLPEGSGTAVFTMWRRVVIADIRTGTVRTLLSFPPIPHTRSVQTVLMGRTLIVAYSRDLLLLDLDNFKLRKYIPEFIQGGFSDNGFGLDRNYIQKLRVDGDRLIAQTFGAENTTIVKIADLLR